jgi:hypothetical protein
LPAYRCGVDNQLERHDVYSILYPIRRRRKLLGRAGRGPPTFWPLWAAHISGPPTFEPGSCKYRALTHINDTTLIRFKQYCTHSGVFRNLERGGGQKYLTNLQKFPSENFDDLRLVTFPIFSTFLRPRGKKHSQTPPIAPRITPITPITPKGGGPGPPPA